MGQSFLVHATNFQPTFSLENNLDFLATKENHVPTNPTVSEKKIWRNPPCQSHKPRAKLPLQRKFGKFEPVNAKIFADDTLFLPMES